MSARRKLNHRWLLSSATAAAVGGLAWAESPAGLPKPPDQPIILVQLPPPAEVTQPTPGAATPTAPPPASPVPAAPAASAMMGASANPVAAGGGASVVNLSGASVGGGAPSAAAASAAASTAGAQDLGAALGRAAATAGVQVQKRNPVQSDARIRGLRNGQYLATGDGAPFYPARLDLDTPISKFDKDNSIVFLQRGPYTSLLGPGFGFLDIATPPVGRSKTDDPEYGGRTVARYQTNGNAWSGLQTGEVRGPNYGFRASYNVLTGNDYRAGNGDRVPASYTSNNFNFALEFDLTSDSTLSFRGLRSRQENVEIPGQFFDIRESDSESYAVRYQLRNAELFDTITLDAWYNGTAGTGDTIGARKQTFVSTLLAASFNDSGVFFPGGIRPGLFTDRSTTRYAERSIGYRLNAAWGNPLTDDAPSVQVGTDLNVFGQGLEESIRFTNQSGLSIPIRLNNNGVLGVLDQGQSVIQNQSIPRSNSVDPGIFFEGKMPVGKRLVLRAGSRLDWVVTSTNSRLITGNTDLFGLSGQTPVPGFVPARNGLVLDPRVYSANPAYSDPNRNFNGDLNRTFVLPAAFLSSSYKVDDHTTLSLQYGYAQRAPNLTELYASGPFVGALQTGTSRLIGDPFLSPEKLNQFDVGLTWEYDRIQAGAKGFYAFINDYITYDVNNLSQSGAISQVVFTNTDLATLAGGELFVQADVGDYLTPYATLNYVQGIDLTHADRRRNAGIASSRRNNPATRTFATDTEPLPQIPPLDSRVGFRIHSKPDYQTKEIWWQIDCSARMVAGQFSVATSLGEQTTRGFTLFDVIGYVKVADQWTVTAGVENIGDLLYREHLDPIASTVLHERINPAVSAYYRPGSNFIVTSALKY